MAETRATEAEGGSDVRSEFWCRFRWWDDLRFWFAFGQAQELEQTTSLRRFGLDLLWKYWCGLLKADEEAVEAFFVSHASPGRELGPILE